jgi:hypothetical protein
LCELMIALFWIPEVSRGKVLEHNVIQ